jgi:hypothetical protein
MRQEIYKIINNIASRDKVLGELAEEAEFCFSENKNKASLACLFVLLEQALKLSLDEDARLFDLIKIIKKDKILNNDEVNFLDEMRVLRNAIFHDSHYSYCLESEGKAILFSEDEAFSMLYAKYSLPCFNILLKLL